VPKVGISVLNALGCPPRMSESPREDREESSRIPPGRKKESIWDEGERGGGEWE
jgi:hypothetical protein